MKDIQKSRWGIFGMIILALPLNVFIINAADTNLELLWLLSISIPLFVIATYLAWKLIRKYLEDRLRKPVQLPFYEKLSSSVYPTRITSTELKVKIGNAQCSQPYDACILNIDSMENFNEESIFVDQTKNDEDKYSISESLQTFKLAAGGHIFRIGSDYSGCRGENGLFNSNVFKKSSRLPGVKMIELNLTSVNSINYPDYPVLGITEFSDGKVKAGLFSDIVFNTFSDAEGMIHFLSSLRELSGGKPTGIRICITDKKDFYKICHSVQKTQIIPDFIVVEGPLESAGVGHSSQAPNAGLSFYEAILFVSQTLQIYGLKTKIKLIADGRIISSFDILKVLALGADVICTEMPRYSIIKNPDNELKLSLQFKNHIVNDFYDALINDTVQMMKMCGFRSVRDITLSNFLKHLDVIHSETFSGRNSQVLYTGSVRRVHNSDSISLSN